MVIEFEDQDAALIVMSLMITEALLFKSRYDPNLQTTLSRNIQSIIDRIHEARASANHESYNPQTET